MPRKSAPRWDKHNKRWRVTVRGKSYNLGRDYKRACQRFAEILPEAGQTSERRRPASVAGLVGRWLLLHPSPWTRYLLLKWARLEDAPLAKLPADTLERLDAELHPLAPQTRRHILNACFRVCKWAHDDGLIPRLPRKPKIPKPARRPRDLTAKQVRELFAKLDGPRLINVRRLTMFILATGCRPSEARRLEWSEVNGAEKYCHVRIAKGGLKGRRMIYLTDAALVVLDDIATGKPGNTGYVFPSRQGRPYTREGFASILRRRGVSPYQLRHTFAQRALETLPMEDVAGLLGHVNLQTVQVYAQVRADRLKRAAAKLPPSVSSSVNSRSRSRS